MKPSEELELLPPLDFIPAESLPSQHSQELVQLENWRKNALQKSITSAANLSAYLLYTGLYGVAAFFALIGSAPLFILLVAAMLFFFSFCATIVSWSDCIDNLREYRRIAIPNQLRINAKKEAALVSMAKDANARIADWNSMAKEAGQDPFSQDYIWELRLLRGKLAQDSRRIKFLTGYFDDASQRALTVIVGKNPSKDQK